MTDVDLFICDRLLKFLCIRALLPLSVQFFSPTSTTLAVENLNLDVVFSAPELKKQLKKPLFLGGKNELNGRMGVYGDDESSHLPLFIFFPVGVPRFVTVFSV